MVFAKADDKPPMEQFAYYVGAEGCCIGGGIRALYLTWRSAIAMRTDETQVRIGLTRRTSTVMVTGFEPWAGRIDARALQPQRIAIRLPAYATLEDAIMLVDDQPITPRIEQRIAIFDGLSINQMASLRYPLPRVRRMYHIADKDYETDWLGNVVIDMRPIGLRHPIYRRRAWLEARQMPEANSSSLVPIIDLPILW